MKSNLATDTKRPAPLGLVDRAAVRYQTQILNADGSVASVRPVKSNLILDQGLNLHNYYHWAELFQYAAIGTGTTPVKWDSGTTTFSRSGTTVTSSANFFASGDVGKLLKFDTGAEMYITAFTSATVVTVNTSGTLAAAEGTMWGVNQTALVTETKRSATYGTDGGDNSTSYNSGTNTLTLKRTIIFSAESGPVTYREIGWAPTASGNLFGRDLIPGVGDSLVAGQQYKVVIQLLVTFSPTAPVSVVNVGTGGYDTAGTLMLESIAYGYAQVQAGGGTDIGLAICEPVYGAGNRYPGVITANWTQRTTIGTGGVSLTLSDRPSSKAGYTSGNFFVDFSFDYSIAQGNGTHYGLALMSFSGVAGTTLKFTTPQTKDSSHTLSFTFRMSWGRTLSNA